MKQGGVFRRVSLALVSVFFFLTTSVWGQTQGGVNVHLTAQKVTSDPSGEEKFTLAEQAKPGDIIQYAAVYRNESNEAVTGLQATVPIPQGTVLIADSTKPKATAASTDGKKFADIPLTRTVKKADGQEQEETIPLHDYRALRWTIDRLDGGREVTVSMRVQIMAVEATESGK